jgi:hypothetical protein
MSAARPIRKVNAKVGLSPESKSFLTIPFQARRTPLSRGDRLTSVSAKGRAVYRHVACQSMRSKSACRLGSGGQLLRVETHLARNIQALASDRRRLCLASRSAGEDGRLADACGRRDRRMGDLRSCTPRSTTSRDASWRGESSRRRINISKTWQRKDDSGWTCTIA